jgi:hypothetical protein
MTTAAEARKVEYAKAQAKDMGLRLEFRLELIEVRATDMSRFHGLLEDAKLASFDTVEEVLGYLRGFGDGWTYQGMLRREEKSNE